MINFWNEKKYIFKKIVVRNVFKVSSHAIECIHLKLNERMQECMLIMYIGQNYVCYSIFYPLCTGYFYTFEHTSFLLYFFIVLP